jgi:sirohydrochlorin cobaltochelatase
VDIDGFSDSALVLIGHGSTRNTGSSVPVYHHARALRQRRVFAQVLECFWKINPRLTDVWERVDTRVRRIFFVPLCISQGYLTTEVIPTALGLRAPGQGAFPRAQSRGSRTVFYCDPVGTHRGMTAVLLARARGVLECHPFHLESSVGSGHSGEIAHGDRKQPGLARCPGFSRSSPGHPKGWTPNPRGTDTLSPAPPPRPADTALFIVGHGTEKNDQSRQAVERQADLIRRQRIYVEVHAAFLEEEPRIRDCHRLARAPNVVVVPFFISDGLHTAEDIPVLLGEAPERVHARLQRGQATWANPTERGGKRIWYASAIGTEPLIAEVILERVREAAVNPRATAPSRPGSRA